MRGVVEIIWNYVPTEFHIDHSLAECGFPSLVATPGQHCLYLQVIAQPK